MGEDIITLEEAKKILTENLFKIQKDTSLSIRIAIETVLKAYKELENCNIRATNYANMAELNNSRFKDKIIKKINSRKFYLHQSNIDFETDDILKVLQSLLEEE